MSHLMIEVVAHDHDFVPVKESVQFDPELERASEIRSFMNRKLLESGKSIDEVVSLFDVEDRARLKMLLETLFQTGELRHSYVKRLGEILGFHQSELDDIDAYIEARMEAFRNRVGHDRKLFVQHFAKVWRNREIICKTPEYANIIFNGMNFHFAEDRERPMTLGELLTHYERKELVLGTCNECGHGIFAYSVWGNRYDRSKGFRGFCPVCESGIPESEAPAYGEYAYTYEAMDPIMNYSSEIPYSASFLSIEMLLNMLK